MDNNILHKPVLTREILDLIPKNAIILVDATCGTGGHSLAIVKNFQLSNTNFQLYCLDYDEKSLEKAKEVLEKFNNIEFICANFKNIKKILEGIPRIRSGRPSVDFILADLGFSSWQLANNRGLAFSKNQALDMRLDLKRKTTASDLVNHLDENELANLIYQNSDERFSRPIASAICRARPIFTTEKLTQIIQTAVGNHYRKKIHPATLTFQALRIAVNQEKENLDQFLRNAPECLAKNGILAIITFHSLEAKAVRAQFKKWTKTKNYQILTKQPITPDLNEIRSNPRARSARLVALEKIA